MHQTPLMGTYSSLWGQGPAHGERDCNAPHPHLLCLFNNCTLLLWFSGLPPGTFPIVEFLIPSPQAVSTQPATVLSLDLLSRLHLLALSLCPRQQPHASGWDTPGCGMNHLCRSHSVLPDTDWFLHSPLGSESSLSVPADFPTSKDVLWVQKYLFTFSRTPP